MSRRLSTALFALALGLVGCDSHAGRVLLVVDSDYPVPAVVSEVRVLVGPADDPEDRNGQAFVLTSVDPPPTGTERLPLSLVVQPRDGQSERHVQIEVEGRSAASDEVLIRTTRTLRGFRPGKTVVLPMLLSRACEDVVCGEGQTCSEGRCESAEVDPNTLRIAESAGEEFAGLPMDSGAPVDATTDAMADADAGPTDAMPDAPPECGEPVTLPYMVTLGPDTLHPLTPGPGQWAYSEPNFRRIETFVEWAYTARAGCEIHRVEASVPDGSPEDPTIACMGDCATHATVAANYEIYRDGSMDYDEIIVANQGGAPGRIRLELRSPAGSVTVKLSDWTLDMGISRDEAFVVFHEMTFFSRPRP